jgi:hypothetical protein
MAKRARRVKRQAKPTKKAASKQVQQALKAAGIDMDKVAAGRATVQARCTKFEVALAKAGGQQRVLNVFPDLPDIRDKYYESSLRILAPHIHPPLGIQVRDQGEEGSCTGFGLAAVIDALNATRARLVPDLPAQVSSRMLYEMAKLNDEWKGIAYEGSSVRGAIKGFFHNGVCSETCAPYREKDKTWKLTIPAAKEARSLRLGAYYRLRKSITDFHSALNETGAIYASANIHAGWEDATGKRAIERSSRTLGGHAFAIVGYNESGFWVQNSWGPTWGQKGVAHWSYLDWSETLIDAWVLQLSVPAPDAFVLPRTSLTGPRAVARPTTDTRRGEIIGHFINIDDGKLQETHSTFATPMSTVEETARRLKEETERPTPVSESNPDGSKYDHLVIYAHGGLNGLPAEAARIDHLTPGFKRNRVYNYHLMWGTSAFEVLRDSLLGAARRKDERVGSIITDLADRAFEFVLRGVGTRIWSQIKDDAEASFARAGGGTQGLRPILNAAAGGPRPLALHLVGHSAGSIILGRMLERWAATANATLSLASVHLMAPACTVEFFNEHFSPFIGAKRGSVRIDKLFVYNLTDKREQDDVVGPELFESTVAVYHKSLLYLVSNAFEDERPKRIAGMAEFEEFLSGHPTINHAGDLDKITESNSHGGFDNDDVTMNSILRRILGKEPAEKFKPEELTGF